jgi:hypothetical protein
MRVNADPISHSIAGASLKLFAVNLPKLDLMAKTVAAPLAAERPSVGPTI